MKITQNLENGLAIALVEGRLDASSSIDAQKDLENILDAESSRLLIDLSGLDYISSAGLRVLLVIAKKMQQKGGKIVLAALTPNVKEVFEISGFSSIFKLFDSVDEAKVFLQG
jgi:anti-anti-sigma factor